MEDKKLYTTKEIAEMYGVTPYTVTQTWVKNGLKHCRGSGKSYIYRIVWIEEFLDEFSLVNNTNSTSIRKIRKCRNKKSFQYVV